MLTTDTKEFTMQKINSAFKEKSDDKVKDLKFISQIFEKYNPHSTCLSSLESIASKNTSIDSSFQDNKITQSLYEDNTTKGHK